ncbi:MAG: hypothetical protein GY771_16230 [bacterium]|nr:hypothetical protein [bacterium]
MKIINKSMTFLLTLILIVGLTGCLGIDDEDKGTDEKKFISESTNDDYTESPEDRTVYDMLAYSNGLGYDTSNEKVFEITVTGNKMYPNGPGGFNFVEVVGKNSGSVYGITLAPAQYLDSINLTLYPDDKAKVTACALPVEGGEIMVARLLEKGGKTYWLRDDWGVPLWTDVVTEEVKYIPTYTYSPSPAPKKETISGWEGDLMKEKWHERGEMMKRKWAERNK